MKGKKRGNHKKAYTTRIIINWIYGTTEEQQIKRSTNAKPNVEDVIEYDRKKPCHRYTNNLSFHQWKKKPEKDDYSTIYKIDYFTVF